MERRLGESNLKVWAYRPGKDLSDGNEGLLLKEDERRILKDGYSVENFVLTGRTDYPYFLSHARYAMSYASLALLHEDEGGKLNFRS